MKNFETLFWIALIFGLVVGFVRLVFALAAKRTGEGAGGDAFGVRGEGVADRAAVGSRIGEESKPR